MKRHLLLLLSAALIFGSCPSAFADGSPIAAENDNIRFLQNSQNESGVPLLRYTEKAHTSVFSDETLPTRYDTREKIAFPEVRNQGRDGDCWAFASIAAAEISILNEGGLIQDFSEAHMADNLYYKKENPWSTSMTIGGNRETAAMYFSRGSGPVPEESFIKESPSDIEYKTDISENLAAYVNKIEYLPDTERYVYNPLFTDDSIGALYPPDERYILVGKSETDGNIKVYDGNGGYYDLPYDDYETVVTDSGTIFYHIGKRERDNQIKEAVMQYGCVFSSYYANPQNKHLHDKKFGQYYPGSKVGEDNDVKDGARADEDDSPWKGFDVINELNHAINIVGWDDNFSKDNFKDTPPADGAWIARNSWGADLLDSGYFYISYYDAAIGENTAIFADIDTDPDFEAIYQHDPFGQSSFCEAPSGTWVSNRFDKKSSEPEYITEVGVYCHEADTTVEIAVNPCADWNGNSYVTYCAPEYEESVKQYAEENNILMTDAPTITPVKSQTLKRPGYYVIKLDEPIKIETDSFDVAVCYKSTDGTDVHIPAESPVRGYSENAVANENESFWIQSSTLELEDKTVVATVEKWDTMSMIDSETGESYLYNACIKVMTASVIPGETVFSGHLSNDESGNPIIEINAAGEAFKSGNAEKTLIIVGDADEGFFSDVESIADGQTVKYTLPQGASAASVYLWEDLYSIKPLALPLLINTNQNS